MPSLASDLKYAAREMRRRPGFTLTAVLSLALGVGATTAVFSVIYAVLINPFPYGGADRMGRAQPQGQGRQGIVIPGSTAHNWSRFDRPKPSKAPLGRMDGISPPRMATFLKMSWLAISSPNAPNHWGDARAAGSLADSIGWPDRAGDGTGSRAGLPVLAAMLQRRSGHRRTQHPTGTQDLTGSWA